MNYVLDGKIARAHPYSLDKTLTVEGAAAEAKVTGEAIEAAKAEAKNHADSRENPHGVTKAQVGLGNVDNTSDSEKPVSVLQAEAIADAKQTGANAQLVADNAMLAAETAQTTADDAQTAADNAMNKAEEAKTIAENALASSGGKAVIVTRTVQVFYVDWQNNSQTVNVEGVTADNTVIVSPAPDSYKTYTENGVVCTAQGDGTLTFKCDSAPDDMTVNVVIMGVGA